jgi:hypothetical protein
MDLQSRYSAIQAKESELRQREDALRRQNASISDSKALNFPPLCPFVYHNISEEIPIQSQMFLKLCLGNIGGFLVSAVLNFIACCCSGSFSGYTAADAIQNIVFGLIVGILTGPLAFRVTYLKMYGQCKTGDITLWGLAVKAMLFAWIVIQAVGPKGWGVVGGVMMLDAIGGKGNGFGKAMAVITFITYLLEALLEGFLLGKLMMLFKASGQSTGPTLLTK